GTAFNGHDVGGQPQAVCYSFYPTKNITTGEGGMVTTPDGKVAERVRLLRSQGASGKYMHTTLGFNYRMTDFQGALGRQQLRRLDDFLAARRRNAAVLTEILDGVDGIQTPHVPNYALHSFNQYCVLVDGERTGLSR